MGKRGPKKKPAALDYLDGNPGKHKGAFKKSIGVDPWGKMFTPAHLMKDAKECIAIIEESMPPEIYKKIDSFALACFGMAWAVHKAASIEIGRSDFEWIETSPRGGVSASPWLKILNEAAGKIAALGGRLGLDPISRQELQPVDSSKPDKFSGLIGQESIARGASSSSLKN